MEHKVTFNKETWRTTRNNC